MYSSFILATWFKKRLKQSLLGQAYVDKKKVSGIDTNDPSLKESIYQQYLSSYKDGLYNYIKSDYSTYERKNIKRRYYSGGITITSSPIQLLPKTIRWLGSQIKVLFFPSPTPEPQPLPRRLSEEETRIVFLPDGTIEFESIIRKIISTLYDIKKDRPGLYTKLKKSKGEKQIDFSGDEIEQLGKKGVIAYLPRVKQIILAIKKIEEEKKLLLYPTLPGQKEVVETFLREITKGESLSLQEWVISYVLKKVEGEFSWGIDSLEFDYLKKVWNYPDSMDKFIEHLRVNLNAYLDGEVVDTFLSGSRPEAKKFLLKNYFISVKLLLEYLPYLDIPSFFSEESEGGLFFEEYIEAFIESISGYISSGDHIPFHNELRKFFNNERLRKAIADRADRLTLAMLKKETRITKEELLAVITHLSFVSTFMIEAQEAIVDYIYGMRSKENLDEIISGERDVDEFDQVSPFKKDINDDFPSFREAVLITIRYGLPNQVIVSLTRAISNQKESVKKNDRKFSLDENPDFKNVLEVTKLTLPQLRLLIKEGREFMFASSSMETTKGGIDFLDEKFFKLDTQGKGMDINYDPAKLRDFDITGLTIGEIVVVNPKKN